MLRTKGQKIHGLGRRPKRERGRFDDLTPEASQAAYRVVQEALTNALKHAPGAPVTVAVRTLGSQVAVSVQNAAPRERPSGLERSGGHYGLAAMRERVTACGGSLTAGPDPAGGWPTSVDMAHLPAHAAQSGGAFRRRPRAISRAAKASSAAFHRLVE